MTKMRVTPEATEAEARTSLEYVGPPEQSHPDLGPLVAGRRYQVAASLAAYLCANHSDYWRAVTATLKE
jgi:hypothetical protein